MNPREYRSLAEKRFLHVAEEANNCLKKTPSYKTWRGTHRVCFRTYTEPSSLVLLQLRTYLEDLGWKRVKVEAILSGYEISLDLP